MADKKTRDISIITSPILFSIPEGKKFVKEVITEGAYVHPQNKNQQMNMTVERFQEWVNNFKKKLVDIVYVPFNHSDHPNDNTGFIEDLFIGNSETKPGKKALFAKFNIVLDDVASKIGKTILGNSIGVERFFSPETGEDMGEVMGHIALTNEPYIPHLGEFRAVAFSKDANVNITNYVMEREANNNHSEDLLMTNEEILKMQEKMLELERKAKESDDKAELARKEKEFEAEKVKKMEVAAFERDVDSEMTKLVLSKKLLPAEKDAEVKFAISLGREKATEYISKLAKKADVVELGGKASGNVDNQTGTGEKPKLSELTAIFTGFICKKHSKDRAFEMCKDWEKRYNLAKSHVDDRDTSVKFTRNKTW
jgi:hypothetical protein